MMWSTCKIASLQFIIKACLSLNIDLKPQKEEGKEHVLEIV